MSGPHLALSITVHDFRTLSTLQFCASFPAVGTLLGSLPCHTAQQNDFPRKAQYERPESPPWMYLSHQMEQKEWEKAQWEAEGRLPCRIRTPWGSSPANAMKQPKRSRDMLNTDHYHINIDVYLTHRLNRGSRRGNYCTCRRRRVRFFGGWQVIPHFGSVRPQCSKP